MKKSILLFTLVVVAACSSSSEDTSPKYDCKPESDGCYCSVYATGPPPASAPIECSPAAFPGAVCCADPGWPGTGGPSHSCSCLTSLTKCTSPQVAVNDCKNTPASSSPPSGGGGGSGGCTYDSECHACSDCNACRNGSCVCGHEGSSGSCVY